MAMATEIAVKQLKIHGLPVSIQHPKGTTRIIKDKDGNVVWKKHMFSDYGEFPGTKGRDSDPVDVMVGPLKGFAKFVYIVHMRDMGQDKAAREDEDKCMVGYPSAEAAKQAFHLQYPKNFFQSMTVLPIQEFKKRLAETQVPHAHKKLHAQAYKLAGAAPLKSEYDRSTGGRVQLFRSSQPTSLEKLYAGGQGSGCHGDHCGRPSTGKKEISRSERAKMAFKPSTQLKQAIADKSEQILSDSLKIPRTKDNSPFDLQSKGVGIEVKTLVDNKNNKITMHPESRQRKIAVARKEGLRMYTVVVDRRTEATQYYFASGVGSFRISSMKPVSSLNELKRLVK